MKITFILLIALFSIEAAALGEEPTDENEDTWCVDRKASLNLKQIKCLQNESETKIIRKGLADILDQLRACPKCKTSVIDGEKFSSFYRPLFLITAIFPYERAGPNVRFIFKDGPPREFRSLVSLNDERGVIEFKLIDILPNNKERVRFVKKLRGKKYNQYWNKLEP